MTGIDCSDCYLEIAIGDGVKRSLIRHFSTFIASQLRARSIELASPALLAEKIDYDAWRLASKVLNEVRLELSGALDETLLAPDPQLSVQTILTQVTAAAATAVERHYLADDLFGLTALIGRLGNLAER